MRREATTLGHRVATSGAASLADAIRALAVAPASRL
jgi:hypothetical protein